MGSAGGATSGLTDGSWTVRCARNRKPGIGVLHFHRRWWSPWRVSSVWFQPESRAVMYPVPDQVWEEFLAAPTFEQAMALLRGAEPVPVT